MTTEAPATPKPPTLAAIKRRYRRQCDKIDAMKPPAPEAAPEYAAFICELCDALEKIAKYHAGIIKTESKNAAPSCYYAWKIRNANLAAPFRLWKYNDEATYHRHPILKGKRIDETEKKLVFSWTDPNDKENGIVFTIALKCYEKSDDLTCNR